MTMSGLGQSRHSEGTPTTSGLPLVRSDLIHRPGEVGNFVLPRRRMHDPAPGGRIRRVRYPKLGKYPVAAFSTFRLIARSAGQPNGSAQGAG